MRNLIMCVVTILGLSVSFAGDRSVEMGTQATSLGIGAQTLAGLCQAQADLEKVELSGLDKVRFFSQEKLILGKCVFNDPNVKPLKNPGVESIPVFVAGNETKIMSYYQRLSLLSHSVVEAFLDQLGICQKTSAWGNLSCDSLSSNLEIVLEFSGSETYLILYFGSTRFPVVMSMDQRVNIGPKGFELGRAGSPLRLVSNDAPGDKNLNVKLVYKNTTFAQGTLKLFNQ